MAGARQVGFADRAPEVGAKLTEIRMGRSSATSGSTGRGLVHPLTKFLEGILTAGIAHRELADHRVENLSEAGGASTA